MKHITLLFILAFLSIFLLAQDAKKGLKGYYKGKLDQADEEFAAILKTFKNSALGNYGMALLQSDTAYAGYNLFEAYDKILIADKKRKQIRPQELDDVADYFTLDSIDISLDRINWKLYDEVKKKNTWAFTQTYLALGKEVKYFKQVTELGIAQQYQAVKDTNTIASFNRLMKKYPDANFVPQATTLRNELAYKEVQTKNTPEAYHQFTLDYPDASQVTEAIQKRNDLAYAATLASNTIEAFKKFQTDYPDAEQVKLAAKAQLALEFTQAQTQNNEKAWEDFIAMHPNTPEAERAVQLREKLAYDTAIKLNTQASLDYFMRRSKKTAHLSSAVFNAKAKLLAADLQFAVRQGNAPSLLKKYDNFNTLNKAQNLVPLADGGWLVLAQTFQPKKWQGDAWVFAMDHSGELRWSKQFGKTGDDAFQYAIELPDHSIVLAGYTAAQNASTAKIWAMKVDAKGETLWERTFDGILTHGISLKNNAIYLLTTLIDETRMHIPNLIKIDEKGELIANKTYPMLSNPTALCQTDNGQLWVLLNKHILNVDDNCQLIKQVAIEKYHTAAQIAATSNGTFVVVGKKYDFQKEVKSDFWVAQFSPEGTATWQTYHDRANSQDQAQTICPNPDGSLIVAGLTEMENQDHIWILKLSNLGVQTENMILGFSQSEKRPNIAIGADAKLHMLFHSGLEPDPILAIF